MANLTDKLLDDLLNRQVMMIRAAEGLSGSLIDQFQQVQDQIVTLLKRTDLSRYTRSRTRRLMSDIKDMLETFAEKALNVNAEGAARIADLIQNRTSTDINEVLSYDLTSPVLTLDKLQALMDDSAVLGGRSMADFWDQWPDSTAAAYADVIRNGAVYGASVGDMINAIDESGALSSATNNIATAVRTSTINVANEARLQMYQDSSDVVKGFQWVATLDANTCVECGALDGLQWDLDYNPIGHDLPFPGATAHGNCRCAQVPVTKSWDELSSSTQDDMSDVPDSTRASMDGEVADSVTYNDWLATKPEAFQQDVLGPSRYELWSKGNLNLRDMLSQQGNVLSVAELEKRYG
jgi:SPP1 gp7 family putative phage head morphogenesis protein